MKKSLRDAPCCNQTHGKIPQALLLKRARPHPVGIKRLIHPLAINCGLEIILNK
jgi:hypothetical protein